MNLGRFLTFFDDHNYLCKYVRRLTVDIRVPGPPLGLLVGIPLTRTGPTPRSSDNPSPDGLRQLITQFAPITKFMEVRGGFLEPELTVHWEGVYPFFPFRHKLMIPSLSRKSQDRSSCGDGRWLVSMWAHVLSYACARHCTSSSVHHRNLVEVRRTTLLFLHVSENALTGALFSCMTRWRVRFIKRISDLIHNLPRFLQSNKKPSGETSFLGSDWSWLRQSNPHPERQHHRFFEHNRKL